MSRQALINKYRHLGPLVTSERELAVIRRAGAAITEDGSVAPSATRSNAPLMVIPFYVAGAMATGTNKAIEFLVPQLYRVLRYNAYLKTAPTGSGTQVKLTINSVSQPTMTIAAGNTSTSLYPPYLSLAAGDMLRIDVGTVGATTPGNDLTFLVTVQPDIVE